jgi:GNAT superfamily N-acetyltransferase
MLVRSMQLSDIREVAALCGQLGYPSTAEQITQRFEPLLNDSDHGLLVAQHNSGELIGWLHVLVHKSLLLDLTGIIDAVVTDERHRGQGIGRALMADAEAWAKSKGCARVSLLSNVIRSDTHGFYQHLGYRSDQTSHIFYKPLQEPAEHPR